MNKLNALKQIIEQSQNIVFFGRAGVSTESNIPDFRNANSLYHKNHEYDYPLEVILSHTFFEDNPRYFFQVYYNEIIHKEAKPNKAHWALAKLEGQGKIKAVISQNIDGLHQAAGGQNVLELHGSILNNHCLNCGAKYNLDFMLSCKPNIPLCLDCGSIVRPDIVLYEECLNKKTLTTAQKYIEKAEVLIVGETSLSVFPAAGLLDCFRGEKLVLINKTATDYDVKADLVIHKNIEETFELAVL